MNSSSPFRQLPLTVLLVLPILASASTYKWQDSDGQIHFSDRPPKDVPAELAPVAPSPSGDGETAAQDEMAQPDAEAEPDFKTLMDRQLKSRAYEEVAGQYVMAAASGDIAALIALSNRTALRLAGQDRIEQILAQEVVPFFARFQRLHNVTAITMAVDYSGTPRGFWFYTYIVTDQGDLRPFSILVLEEEGSLGVADIKLDHCVQNRHPFCPP